MRVASKVENLHSQFGHARPLDSPVIRNVCDGRTKATLNAPFPNIRSIHFVNIVLLCECTLCVVNVFFILLFVCMFVFSFCALPYW